MALDGLFLHCLIDEIKEKALNARVDKIHQPSKSELVFSMRTRTGTFKLFISANPESARINISELDFDNPKAPPMLCMLLRKRLGTAILTDVRQDGLDRVAFFDFLATDELGDKQKLTLIVEIMAQHSNIILIDAEGKIIDSVKRIDESKSSYREILPGLTYVPPPVQNKLNILSDDTGDIIKAIKLYGTSTLSGALLKVLSGVSPLTAREIAYRAYNDELRVAQVDSAGYDKLLTVLCELKSQLLSSRVNPTVISSGENVPFEFSFGDLTQYGEYTQKVYYGSLSELLDSFYNGRDSSRRMKARSSELFRLAENSLERITKKILLREAELEECKNRENLRINAELITVNQYALEKGQQYYEVINYYEGDKPVRIKADPALTPSQNAQKYYKEYRKSKTAEEKLAGLIEEGRAELLYFESVCDSLSRSTAEAELDVIYAELVEQGYIKSLRKGQKKISKPAKLSVIKYHTSDGFEVLVGRNNTQNDYLSFKLAEKSDIWFHVTKAPGSHVILRTAGKEPSDAAVIEAARLAVKHSSVTGTTKTSVDYTEVRNLKKPNGAKPGFVVYNDYFSIIV